MTEKLEYFMWEALREGRKALPNCLPNPPVGCVLVRDQDIIARGYTNQPGADHAEAMALRQISGDLSDVKAFVTLEPCSFHGRTPSCAKAFVSRKIEKVYVAMLDPDPRNNGLGIALLEQAGIAVSVGLLQREAELDIGRYLWKTK
ncbi:MAG: riboflavin-specific deaminase [Dolichospermum sp. DEX182a]|nr:riboflavin-specific deaminase [Dolichospermum sp. DEX182a]QSV64258.1 MAG: riboflavin-specific deaminase [Dolichospermum sp. DL01]